MPTHDRSFRQFAVHAILPRLERMWMEAKGVRAGRDIEHVHRMRVASRRLRTALNLTAPALPGRALPGWMKQVRRITRALGAARDADVQILLLERFMATHPEPELQPGLSRILLRLQQQRHELQDDVLSALDEFENTGTLDQMCEVLHSFENQTDADNKYSGELAQHASAQINERLRDLFSHEPYLAQPDRKQEHHRMRIAAKHLRYAMETFSPLYAEGLKSPITAVKRIQESLGEVHDCDIWVEQLPEFLEKERVRSDRFFGHDHSVHSLSPGIDFLKDDRSRERAERFAEYCRYWEKLKKQGLLEKLEQATRVALPAPTTNRTEGTK